MVKQKDLVEELEWRGLVDNIIPGTKEQLLKEMTLGYIGFDPTSDSLHIGNLVPIILLIHMYKFGHKPIAVMGGSTGLIGDPSGKSAERNLLDEQTLNKNIKGIKKVLSKFLDFDSKKQNAPLLVNNYNWTKDLSFINFARDIGKRITVNYMINKESVKNRISTEAREGMSFTEFTYQLLQAYDFYYLYKNYNCLLQMGGADQWGNITTGTELIRKCNEQRAFAITCPLITKADGSKFGKTESGNIWLDKTKTSPYKFYQFWLNTPDEDAQKYIKIFTFLSKNEIKELILEHMQAPHLRLLQKKLAQQVTTMVHSSEDYQMAIKASEILFGKSTYKDLKDISEQNLLDIFEGVPQAQIDKQQLKKGIDIISILVGQTNFLKSNGEARRALKENSISVNKEKVRDNALITSKHLLNDKYILLQRGKKNYFLVKTL